MPNFRNAIKKVIFNTLSKKSRSCPKGFKKNELTANELLFDSASEFAAYIKLKEQEKAGIISNLQLQITYLLVPKTRWFNNVTQKEVAVRSSSYIADFVFTRDGKEIICDCKGWKLVKGKWTVYIDDIYKIKKKLMLLMYPQYTFEEL